MPGLSLVLTNHIEDQLINEALADLESDSISTAHVLYKDKHFALIFSGHEGYPYRLIEQQNYIIILEGIVYNRTAAEIDASLNDIAQALSAGKPVDKAVGYFVASSDGDFLCSVYSKRTSSLLVFNDHLGRLHAFYHKSTGVLALSREMKFLLRFMPEITIDRYGLALFMMFEYTLGNTTLIQNVKRMLSSRSIHARIVKENDQDDIDITNSETQKLVFDESGENPSKSICIDRLSGLFMESVENRYNRCSELGYTCIADVSGGFDTRTVMLGLEIIGANVEYFTHDLVSGDESAVAYELGRVYGKPIRTVSASHELDFEEIGQLVYATDCMVNGWTALTSWRDSGEKKRMLGDKTVSFMGFGGEFIRHPFHPALGYRSLQSMLRANLFKSPLTADWASAIAGIPYDTFIEAVETYFETYPEQTLAGKLKHLYFEYYNILVNAGEDRTRRFFWTVQPLWAKDMYTYEMNDVPLEYAHFSFYADFIRALDPKALGVPLYGSRVRLDSDFSLRLFDATANMKYHVRNTVLSNKFLKNLYFRHRGRERNTGAYKKAAETALATHKRLNYLNGVIPKEHINRFINSGYGLRNLYRLITVLLYFEQLEKRFGGMLTV
ncbi:hypothetical protein ACFL60_03175 [Candidatus Omnitrophota bacterium]